MASQESSIMDYRKIVYKHKDNKRNVTLKGACPKVDETWLSTAQPQKVRVRKKESIRLWQITGQFVTFKRWKTSSGVC